MMQHGGSRILRRVKPVSSTNSPWFICRKRPPPVGHWCLCAWYWIGIVSNCTVWDCFKNLSLPFLALITWLRRKLGLNLPPITVPWYIWKQLRPSLTRNLQIANKESSNLIVFIGRIREVFLYVTFWVLADFKFVDKSSNFGFNHKTSLGSFPFSGKLPNYPFPNPTFYLKR